ncbi:hypothetical protein NDU88_000303 [Pleurodeles waltl]|uniref:Uncharacterized protein n=1 Tax=Pleurodeles waltl TaxID=8319 RepID=A0AAV7S9P9_PLEWA|nr:hypothetical protein NDU88_000303 [Pleurodeles waltl]
MSRVPIWSTATRRSHQCLFGFSAGRQGPLSTLRPQEKHQPNQMPSTTQAQVPQAAIRSNGPKPGSDNVQEASSSAQGPAGGPHAAATPKLQPQSSNPYHRPSALSLSIVGATQRPEPPSAPQAWPGPPDTGPHYSVSHLETPADYS